MILISITHQHIILYTSSYILGDIYGMDPMSIPTYVTVKLAVATGMAQGNKKTFQKLLSELVRSAKRRAKDASLNQGRPPS